MWQKVIQKRLLILKGITCHIWGIYDGFVLRDVSSIFIRQDGLKYSR